MVNSRNILTEGMTIADFINDYLEFGIYNGEVAIKAYLVYWSLLSEKTKKLRMAKIIAEYGRALEELFVFLYVMAEQVKKDKNVFFDNLIYYDTSKLNSFIESTDFADFQKLLGLSNAGIDKVAKKAYGWGTENTKAFLSEATNSIIIFKDDRRGDSHKIYNKLKHPFLVYSRVPKALHEGLSFGVIQKRNKDERDIIDFGCVPIKVSEQEALNWLQRVQAIGGYLKFFLTCFLFWLQNPTERHK